MNDRYRFEPRKRARRRALQAIYQWQITAQDASEILSQFKAAQDMKGVDEEHLEELLRGVISRQEELDQALQPFLDRPFGQVDQMERAVLRIGAYELLHCPEMPFRVVLDECVDIAHRFGSENGHAFVNAVLDKAARQWRDQESGGTPSQD
jgi:N utilization substance protein B